MKLIYRGSESIKLKGLCRVNGRDQWNLLPLYMVTRRSSKIKENIVIGFRAIL